MKLERVLRKAAPFLLIAILIACLFNMPQKEGMKSAKHWFEEHKGVHVADVAGGAALGGATVWVGKQLYDSRQLAKKMNEAAEEKARAAAAPKKFENLPERDDFDELSPERSSAVTLDGMNPTARKVFGKASEFTEKASEYSKDVDDVDDVDA